jgi:hypothetical protein
VKVEFTSPSGKVQSLEAFWYDRQQWRFRFSPSETGTWKWRTTCSQESDRGLHNVQGTFDCLPYAGNNPLFRHGAVEVSGTHFAHADGTPFFWMADTAWNGLLRPTEADWSDYLGQRREQGFNVIQCVLTQWRGGRATLSGAMYYTNAGQLAVEPGLCRTIDARLAAINAQGILAAPVLLWALTPPDPGRALPEPDAIRLGRYMTARWGAFQVAWLLGGDGDYGGAAADRWRAIGRGVFQDRHDRPVTLHPGGSKWVLKDFTEETWFDFVGYQSGHNGADTSLRWLTMGPPARDWRQKPTRPLVNLEPNYELHTARNAFTDYHVRRAAYWSLLIAPTAGVTYGNSPIWVWNDKTGPAEGHERLGEMPSWREGLRPPGVLSMTHLKTFFTSGPFHELAPAPELLEEQPGLTNPANFIAVAQDARDTWVVAYLPKGGTVKLRSLQPGLGARWYNPRTGQFTDAGVVQGRTATLNSPTAEDWVLDLR